MYVCVCLCHDFNVNFENLLFAYQIRARISVGKPKKGQFSIFLLLLLFFLLSKRVYWLVPRTQNSLRRRSIDKFLTRFALARRVYRFLVSQASGTSAASISTISLCFRWSIYRGTHRISRGSCRRLLS